MLPLRVFGYEKARTHYARDEEKCRGYAENPEDFDEKFQTVGNCELKIAYEKCAYAAEQIHKDRKNGKLHYIGINFTIYQ